ncbi:hypothetical protein TNCV_3389741 [Trichonephila clavipes]|nr:hypothetical protein TNCV_3389741 [Trichonephila clavipes]
MDSLGHSSLPPTALGRQDDEETTSGVVTQQVLEIKTRSHLVGLTEALLGIPYVLKDSCLDMYPPVSYRYSSDEVFH